MSITTKLDVIPNLGNSNMFQVVRILGGKDAVMENGRSISSDTVTEEPIAKPARIGRFNFLTEPSKEAFDRQQLDVFSFHQLPITDGYLIFKTWRRQ